MLPEHTRPDSAPRRVETLRDKDRTIQAMVNAAKVASGILRGHFGKFKELQIDHKGTGGHVNLVTNADEESQEAIKRSLTGELGNDTQFFGEERRRGEAAETIVLKDRTFVVDPLDGTTNFKNGIGYFAISIAEMNEKGEAVRGVTMNPLTGEILVGIKGDGAYEISGAEGAEEMTKLEMQPPQSDDRSIPVSVHKNPGKENELLGMEAEILKDGHPPRNMGSVVEDFSGLVKGKFRAVLNGGAFLWDYLAAKVIIEEAGGVIEQWNGDPVGFNARNPRESICVLACHRNERDYFRRVISEGIRNS